MTSINEHSSPRESKERETNYKKSLSYLIHTLKYFHFFHKARYSPYTLREKLIFYFKPFDAIFLGGSKYLVTGSCGYSPTKLQVTFEFPVTVHRNWTYLKKTNDGLKTSTFAASCFYQGFQQHSNWQTTNGLNTNLSLYLLAISTYFRM